eukprot:scaffold129_cov254-Pinguiococcus_pyrenoidosus.AAC.22
MLHGPLASRSLHAPIPSDSPAAMSYVIKRSGEREPVHFDKITRRIERLCDGTCSVLLFSSSLLLFAERRPRTGRALRGPCADRPEGDSGGVSGSHDRRAGRTCGANRGLLRDAAPGLLQARRAHLGVEPPQAERSALQFGHRELLQLCAPQDRRQLAARVGRGLRPRARTCGSAGQRHLPRAGLRL